MRSPVMNSDSQAKSDLLFQSKQKQKRLAVGDSRAEVQEHAPDAAQRRPPTAAQRRDGDAHYRRDEHSPNTSLHTVAPFPLAKGR